MQNVVLKSDYEKIRKAYEEDKEIIVVESRTKQVLTKAKAFFELKYEEGYDDDEVITGMEAKILKNPIMAIPYALGVGVLVYAVIVAVYALPF